MNRFWKLLKLLDYILTKAALVFILLGVLYIELLYSKHFIERTCFIDVCIFKVKFESPTELIWLHNLFGG